MADAPARRQIAFTGPGGGDGNGGLGSGETLTESEIIETDGLVGNYLVDSGGFMSQDSRSIPKNLSGSVAYSNYSEVSNASDSISGISQYNRAGRVTRCYSPDGDGFGADFDVSADCGIVFVSAPNVIGIETATLPGERRVGYGQTAVGVIYEFNRDGYEGFVDIFNDDCSLISNPYRGFNEVGIITGRAETPFEGPIKVNSDGTVIATVTSKRAADGSIFGSKVVVYQRGRNPSGNASYKKLADLNGSDDDGYANDFAISGDGKIIFVNSIKEESGGCDGTVEGVIYVYERRKTNYFLLGTVDPGEVIGRKGPYPNSNRFGRKLVTNMDGSILAASDTARMFIFNRNKEYFDNYYSEGCNFTRERDKHIPYIVTQVIPETSPLEMSADGRSIVVSAGDNGGVCFTNGLGNQYLLRTADPKSPANTYGSASADGKTVVFAGNSGSTVYKIEGNAWYKVDTIGGTSGKVKMSADGKYVMDSDGYIWHQARDTYVYADEDGNIGVGVEKPTVKLDINGDCRVRSNLNVNGDLTVDGTFAADSFTGDLNGNATSATTAGTATVAQGLTGTPNITVNAITADSLDIRRIDTTGSVFVGNDLSVTGTKSFDIPHPSKEGWRLKYVCLEGPTADVYVRGKLEDSNVIELPDYWVDLVDQETIMVSLTPFGVYQELFVEKIEWGKKIIVKNNSGGPIKCSYVVYAERKDVDRNQTEYQP